MDLDHAVEDLTAWLFSDGKDSTCVMTFLPGYVEKLQELDFPVHRIFMGSQALHPQAGAWNWKYDVDAEQQYVERTIDRKTFEVIFATMDRDEPFIRLELEGIDFIRHRSTDERVPAGGMTDLLQNKGYHDVYGLPFYYKGKFYSAVTWATKRKGGFTEEHIQLLERTKSALMMTLQVLCNELVTRTLLCTYLGADAGTRVHKGSILRGDGSTVRAAIWFSDIRGFTALSARSSRDEVIDLVNDVFDVTESVLKKYGGDILKFMGDGCLAVITEPEAEPVPTIEGHETGTSFRRESIMQFKDATRNKSRQASSGSSVCLMAMKAAEEFQERIAEMSRRREAEGLEGAKVGVGLHYGDCSYGNVGGATRLDFTVIGPSVNLASRVESLCSSLQAKVLATEDFLLLGARHNDWIHRGEYKLKGVKGEIPVYELNTTKKS